MDTKMGNRIKQLRKQAGFTQEQLGDILGVQKSAIAKYENGRVENLKKSTILKMAEIFCCRPSYVMGLDDDPGYTDSSLEKVVRPRKIPILGEICCGDGGFDDEDTTGVFVADQSINADYALHVRGSSMIDAGIEDGDTVFLKAFSDKVQNGKIYAVRLLAENLSFLKKVYQNGPDFTLVACNPGVAPIVADYTEIKIVGEYVGVYKPAR